MWESIRWALGIDTPPQDFTTLQLCLRAALIYIAGWAILRAGGNRFLGRETAFDIVLGFVLGSALSRAINGSGALFQTIAAAALLVGLHQCLAWATFRSHRFGELMKGRPEALIRDGRLVEEGLRRHRISPGDLDEALRLHAHLDDPAKVKEARFERNGDISIVKKEREKKAEDGGPRIVEVRVEQGVQTVRIELS
jgi:uncharacterized membrane protein YcaP (DUF421 family)